MRHLRLATILMLSAFTFLCVGYANSQTGSEQIYQTRGNWTLLVGSCQLKVKTLGSQVAFIPTSASGTSFLGSIPDAANADLPVDLVFARDFNGGTVREALHIRFTVQNGVVQPVEFDLTRAYEQEGTKTQKIETSCSDLKPVGS